MKISARHEHDLGLQHDLELIAAQARQRRRVLSWMGRADCVDDAFDFR